MNPLEEDLLARLDATDEEGWEAEYARCVLPPLSDEAVTTAAATERPLASWLAFRVAAGPPGEALPDVASARQAIEAETGSPRDAYCFIFRAPPLAEDLNPVEQVRLLWSASNCAFGEGFVPQGIWFGVWLATRASLAAIALGAPQLAWARLDHLSRVVPQHPQLQLLTIFAPLRHSQHAQHSPLIHAMISDQIWPQTNVPVLPTLLIRDEPPSPEHVAEVWAELEALGASHVLVLLRAFLRQQQEDELLVRELRARALRRETSPPEVEELPDWFADWARDTLLAGELDLARLAGLLMYQVDKNSATMAAVLVLPTSKAIDLELLSEGLPAEMQALVLMELKVACERLPEEVADALVAASLPGHTAYDESPSILIEHVGYLEALSPRPGGLIEHIIHTTQDMAAACQAQVDQLLKQISSEAERLRSSTSALDSDTIEQSLSKISVPELSYELCRLAINCSRSLGVIEQILTLLALHNALGEAQVRYKAELVRLVSRLMIPLHEPGLTRLRLRLLNDALSRCPTAELYIHRANLLLAYRLAEARTHEQAFSDLGAALRLSHAEQRPDLYAEALATRAQLLAKSARAESSGWTPELDEAQASILDTLETLTELPAQTRASLHLAHGHLLRLRAPDAALGAFEEALDQLEPHAPQRLEIAAEVVIQLILLGRVEEAIERGQREIESSQVAASPSPGYGRLLLALGQALKEARRWDEARQQLEACVELLRGRDMIAEAQARLHLAFVGLQTGAHELVDEHHHFLQSRLAQLDPLTRREVERLGLAIVTARGSADDRRAELERLLQSARHEDERLWVELALATLDLAAERPVDDLDALVLRGLAHESPHDLSDRLAGILCDHGARLDASTLERGLAWATRPNVSANLQFQLGRVEEARRTLREARDGELTPDERLACTHQLLTMLDVGEHRKEWRRLCDELERLIEAVGPTAPGHISIDLALAIQQAADQRDLRAAMRAWQHADRGLRCTAHPSAREAGERIKAHLTLDILRASLPLSSPQLARAADWLLDRLVLDTGEASLLRTRVAGLLLAPGPITHPDALGVAEALLATEHHPRDTEELDALRVRLRWVQQVAGYPEAPSAPQACMGPLDTLPRWLLAHVHGHEIGLISPEVLLQNPRQIIHVIQTRPDVADSLLALVISMHRHLPEGDRGEVLEVVYNATQQAVAGGDGVWAASIEALTPLLSTHPHPRLAHILAAMRRAAPSAQTNEAPQTNTTTTAPQDRARGCFDRGVALMNHLSRDPMCDGAQELIAEARAQLAEAVDLARAESMPELIDYMTSHGNAWKMDPNADIERALDLYDQAEALLGDEPGAHHATLWKVRADALLSVGGDANIRLAAGLLERACELRQGRLLAETLRSLARVMREHPDLPDELTRTLRALELTMQAVRTSPPFGDQDGVIDFLRQQLTTLARLSPTSPQIAATRDELCGLYPHRAERIKTAVIHYTDREIESITATLTHPAGIAFMEIQGRLLSPNEQTASVAELLRRLGPSIVEQVRTQQAEHTLIGRPDEIERVLASLDLSDEETRPGLLAARVLLLAQLVRLERASRERVLTATNEAAEAIQALDAPLVQAMLLREIARVWAPDDHAHDPLRDFNLAVALRRQSLALEGGEARATADTLGALARALRYTPDGLAEARHFYTLALQRACESGDPDIIANLTMNLAELEEQQGVGGRQQRLLETEALMARALEQVRVPHLVARHRANFAWHRTQLGAHDEGDERIQRIQRIQEALSIFDAVELDLLDAHERLSWTLNRNTCESLLIAQTQGRAAGIAFEREHLSDYPASAPHLLATAQHNLAISLMFGESITRDELAEGLALCREALRVRTIEADPRHHWETTFNMGRALFNVLMAEERHLLPMPDVEALREARRHLEHAIDAARLLGAGEELAETALRLCALSMREGSTMRMLEHAERAWSVAREAAASLLLSPSSRQLEARTAQLIAQHLALRLPHSTNALADEKSTFILDAQQARLVERWVVRSQQPARRPLQARLSRPRSVSDERWRRWRAALSGCEQREMTDALALIHEVAPTFLAEDRHNETTQRWLRGRPGSVAVSLVYSDSGASLALIMEVDEANRPQTRVLGLDLSDPPSPLTELLTLRQGTSRSEQTVVIEALSSWLRARLVGPVLEVLGRTPSVVLWNPAPLLRLLPPTTIWERIPCATTTSLILPDPGEAPRRHQSKLIALADPGDQNSPAVSLGEFGERAIRALEEAVTTAGRPVRLMGSAGPRFGRALLGEQPHVRNTPVSPQDFLQEAREHEVVVLIAHGEVETIEDAAFLCLDASGQLTRLDVAQLAQNPDALSGATVVLLSCESGRVDDSMVDPGGLAGTLLSAGAACVVAPLWPVQLDVAQQVGCAVLQGLAHGEEPWDVLRDLNLQTRDFAPTLGRPPRSSAERTLDRELQRLAFVVWVG